MHTNRTQRLIPLNWAAWLFLLYNGSLALLLCFLFSFMYGETAMAILTGEPFTFFPDAVFMFVDILLVIFYIVGALLLLVDKQIAKAIIFSQQLVNLAALASRIVLPAMIWDEPVREEGIFHYGTILNVFINLVLLYYYRPAEFNIKASSTTY